MRALFLAGLTLAGGLAWAAEPDRTEVERAEARRMVKQLGSRDGMERLAAERRLLELGRSAVDAVKDGRTSDATQVADRCERLIVRLREDGGDTPAWKEFTRVCGDSASAKSAYRSMATVNELGYWLEKIDDDPAAAQGAYQAALDSLVKWQKRVPEGQRGWVAPPRHHAVFLLFVGGMDAAVKVKGPTGEVQPREFQEVIRAVVRSAVLNVRGEDEAVGAALLVRWMTAQTRDDSKLGALFAFQYGVPGAAMPLLTAWAADKTQSAAVRVRSMGLVAACGVDVTTAAESLLWMKEEYASQQVPAPHNGPMQTRTAQVRDIAAVHLIRARGYLREDFGFLPETFDDEGQKHRDDFREWGELPMWVSRYGFTDDAARDRAHFTLKALLALKPAVAAKPLSKAVAPSDDPPELLAEIADIEEGLRSASSKLAATRFARDFVTLSRVYGYSERVRYERARLEFHYADLLRPAPGSLEQAVVSLRATAAHIS